MTSILRFLDRHDLRLTHFLVDWMVDVARAWVMIFKRGTR